MKATRYGSRRVTRRSQGFRPHPFRAPAVLPQRASHSGGDREHTDEPGQAITEREALACEIERRERRRAVGVKLTVLVGALLLASGLTAYILTGGSASGQTSPLALVLMAAGLLVAFPLAAILALVLGPTWPQRQRHIGLVRREASSST